MKKYFYFKIINKDKIYLIPADKRTEDLLKGIVGDEVVLTYVKERNLKFHRKLFAILKAFIDNLNGNDLTIEELLTYLKLKVGYYKKIKFKGQDVIIPDSISFAEMTQDEFEKFYKQAVKILADVLNVTVEDLENNADEWGEVEYEKN